MRYLPALLLVTVTPAVVGVESFPHINVELVANYESVQPGQNIKVGWLLKPDEGWHVYWKNPGDTGLAPSFDWQETQDVMWPFPSAIPLAHLINYGYKNEVLLASNFSVDSTPYTLTSKISWLVCKESCIPGETQQTLNIQPGKPIPSPQANIFAQTEKNLPTDKFILGGSAQHTGESIVVTIYAKQPLFNDATTVNVFPEELDVVNYSATPNTTWKNNFIEWRTQPSEYYSKNPETLTLVVVKNDEIAYRFKVPFE